MARKLRVEYEGAIYHVVNRGVDRRRLFDNDADRQRFVTRLSRYAVELEVRVYLYCLMSNHVHLFGGDARRESRAVDASGWRRRIRSTTIADIGESGTCSKAGTRRLRWKGMSTC